jgi:hypothetical protein
VETLEKQIETLREAIEKPQSGSAPAADASQADTSEEKSVKRGSKLAVPKTKGKMMEPPETPDHGVYRCWVRKRDKGTVMADFFGLFLSRYVVLDGVFMRWFNAANKTEPESAMGTFDFSDMSQGNFTVEEQEDGMLLLKTPGGFFDCDIKENPLNPGEAFLAFGVALQKAISHGGQVYQYNIYTRGVECGAIVLDEDEAES